jgi:hypothetical protein
MCVGTDAIYIGFFKHSDNIKIYCPRAPSPTLCWVATTQTSTEGLVGREGVVLNAPDRTPYRKITAIFVTK